jgi:hypothetical protein
MNALTRTEKQQKGELNMKSLDDVFGAVVLATLLLLCAWGNATAMLVVSAILLVAGLVLFRAHTFRSKLLALVLGSVVAAAVVIVIR